MNRLKSAEFAQFSFVRDAKGNVIELPSQAMGERVLLVIDGDRWGLSRLHIFEGMARRREILEGFEAEMQAVSRLWGDSISQVVAWGRDSEELFYADEMLDGEPLPDYLGRTGKVPVATVGEWMVQLIDALEATPDGLPSFERFSTQSLQVVVDRFGKVRPVFSEFHGWMKPGTQVSEHTREWYLAQVFCSLVGGVPVRTFHYGSLPRNFDELEGPVKNAVLDALGEGQPGAYDEFCAVMRSLALEGQIGEMELTLPRMPVREWLRGDLEELNKGASLPDELNLEGDRYSFSSEIRGTESLVHLLPGIAVIPREGWLNQHHEVTRRAGRVKLNQLQVNLIEDEGSLTFVGEERVEGATLADLIHELGPFSLEETGQVMDRLSAVLTMLECQVGGNAVWWLPPENVLWVTGTHTRAAAGRYVRRKGDGAWQEISVKLRLHQTMTTLRRGVDLPSRVRDLSRLPGKKFEFTRRSAVALPLIWYALTRQRFRWESTVEEQLPEVTELPNTVLRLLEEYRGRLIEVPAEVDSDLFTRFQRELSSASAGRRRGAEESGQEDDLESMLDSVLYEGEVSLEER